MSRIYLLKFWCSTLFLSHFVYNLNETFTGESTLYFDAFLLTVLLSVWWNY